MLSDCRKDHGEALDELLSVNVATLSDAGVVKLRQVGLMIADRQFGAFELSIAAVRAPNQLARGCGPGRREGSRRAALLPG